MSDLRTVLTLAGHYGAQIGEIELSGPRPRCWHDDCGTADVLISWTGICERPACWGHVADTLAHAALECDEAGDQDPHLLLEVITTSAITVVAA